MAIPDDYGNLLCLDCYGRQVREIEVKKKEEANQPNVNLENKEAQNPVVGEVSAPAVDSGLADTTFGILDPNYKSNPEATDKEQWGTNIAQFKGTGQLLWHVTRDMYEFIKRYCMERTMQHPQYPKFIWKPKIVDVGCGIGVGSNILSQEADFVWGIDKNVNSVNFAKEAFTRVKNNIYYSSQLSFDNIDIVSDNRDFMKFEVVVAIEVIEHIYDTYKFLTTLINRFAKKNKKGEIDREDPTTFFLSTPNRNNKSIQKDKPKNSFHVREWTSGEYHALLSRYFEEVKLFNSAGVPCEIETNHTPIIARCRFPK